MAEFGEKLKAAREAKGMSQKALKHKRIPAAVNQILPGKGMAKQM